MKRLLLTALLACACRNAAAAYPPTDPSSGLTYKAPAEAGHDNNGRLDNVGKYGFIRGVADGRSARMAESQKKLSAGEVLFDQIFDVSPFYLEGGQLQPPIIIVANSIMSISDNGKTKENVKKQLTMVAPEQWVTAPLNWKSFLITEADLHSSVADDPVLFPKDQEEKAAYNKFYLMGFDEGQAQADSDLLARVKTLTTTVVGIRLSDTLLRTKVLKRAQIVKSNIPVSGNDVQLSLGTEVSEIIKGSAFELDTARYQAIVNRTK